MSELNETSARAAIESVLDPIYERSLGELGLVREVQVQSDPSGPMVRATLTVHALSEEKHQELTRRVEAALQKLGAARMDISLAHEAPMR
ncbi:MAG TPA: iron-sulfur cluster assembly protein, partial [Polyangiales bacterium]|nr:iron-sulfur cluster assembly protein [Polyangiales bacterium]